MWSLCWDFRLNLGGLFCCALRVCVVLELASACYLSFSPQLCSTEYVFCPACKSLDMIYFGHISGSEDTHLVCFLLVDIPSEK